MRSSHVVSNVESAMKCPMSSYRNCRMSSQQRNVQCQVAVKCRVPSQYRQFVKTSVRSSRDERTQFYAFNKKWSQNLEQQIIDRLWSWCGTQSGPRNINLDKNKNCIKTCIWITAMGLNTCRKGVAIVAGADLRSKIKPRDNSCRPFIAAPHSSLDVVFIFL